MEKIEVLKELLTKVYNLNPTGSLSNLRKIIGEGSNCESKTLQDLAGYAHLVSFNLFKEAQDHTARFFLESNNFTMQAEVNRLIDFYHQPRLFTSHNRHNVDSDFRYYCQSCSLTVIKVLQVGIDHIRRCSWVYLVRDIDGIVKVYKEVLQQKNETEDILYSKLPTNGFFPKLYGVIDINGIKFIKQSVHFGKNLNIDQPVSTAQARSVVLRISQSIQFLHSNGIIYLDVKPENFIINSSTVLALDLGVSQLMSGKNDLDICLSDPRFATPEGATALKATPASDVFQLGLLYFWLINGHHPFDLVPLIAQDLDLDRQSALLRYALPTAVLDFKDVYPHSLTAESDLITAMLDREPSRRPTIDELILTLNHQPRFFVQKHQNQPRTKQNNTILFPARMGIPHQGHIEYISRLLHLGYYVLISIQRCYTLTNRDPIQKSFVMKMVSQSLIDQGFVPDVDFGFISTPYYQTQTELEYHFLSLPQIDDIIAVASGNPSISKLFPDWPIFDQNSVFGSQGEAWQVLSWGETVRQSVRDNDYDVFRQYAASGVEKILSFQELQSMISHPQIDFTKTVDVVCLQNDLEVTRGRVFRYQFPEQSIVSHLRSLHGFCVKVDNLYSRDSEINLNDQSVKLSYLKTEFDSRIKHESIYFNLLF